MRGFALRRPAHPTIIKKYHRNGNASQMCPAVQLTSHLFKSSLLDKMSHDILVIIILAMCSHGVDVKHAPNNSICIYQMGTGPKDEAKQRCLNNSDKLMKLHSIQFIYYIARLSRSNYHASKYYWLDYDSVYGIDPCIGLRIIYFIIEELFCITRATPTGTYEFF